MQKYNWAISRQSVELKNNQYTTFSMSRILGQKGVLINMFFLQYIALMLYWYHCSVSELLKNCKIFLFSLS